MPHLRGWAVAGRHAYLPAIGRHEVLVVDTDTWAEVGRIAGGRPAGVRDGAARRPPGVGQLRRARLPPRAGHRHADASQVVQTLEPGKAVLHMEFTPRGEAVWISCARRQPRDRSSTPRASPRWRTLDVRRAQRHLLHQPRARGWGSEHGRADVHRTPLTLRPAQRLAARLSARAASPSPRIAAAARRWTRATVLDACRAAAARRRAQPHRRRVRPPAPAAPRCCARWPCRPSGWTRWPRRSTPRPASTTTTSASTAYNLWFVITGARCRGAARPAIDALERAHRPAGAAPADAARLPHRPRLRPARAPRRCARAAHAPRAVPRVAPPTAPLAALVEDGLPLVERPYAAWAAQLGLAEARRAGARCAAGWPQGTLRRFGVVVRHHELGFDGQRDDGVRRARRRRSTPAATALARAARRDAVPTGARAPTAGPTTCTAWCTAASAPRCGG